MRLFRFLTICGIVAVTSAIATGCATSKKATPAPAERPPEPIARIQDALKEAQDAAAKEPQNARNQYRLGNALFDAERFDGANQLFPFQCFAKYING